MADRPPSKGLAVLGGAPPTRSGAATSSGRTATGAATGTAKRGQTARTAGGTALDPLAQELILKYRLKFGEAAATVAGQEAITKEVLQYMLVLPTRPAKTRDTDLAHLEDRIRTRLLGGTPSKNSLAAAKRGQGADEWLQMVEYDQALGAARQRQEEVAVRNRQSTLRQQLEAQMEEHERQRQQERAQEEAYWREEQAQLRKAEEEEEARRRLQAEIMLKLKQERVQQMQERVNKREAALSRRRAEEALEASRTAYDTAEELRREEASRVSAKLALREFLSGNEANRALKEAEKKRQWEEDAAFQRKWEAILNKQEADRREQLERIKRVQDRLQEAADRQGEARRRWLETPLVERYFKQREDERAAEEERRVARQKEVAKQVTQAVAGQLREREAARMKMKQEEEAYAASVAAKVRAAEEAEKARKAALQEQKLKFRQEIEAQLRDAAMRRREAAKPMTETERRLNARTLQQVATWQSTGRLSLPDLTGASAHAALGGATSPTALSTGGARAAAAAH
ncbi:hypothetical protein Agub_g9411 [Astrephomene gubernaculifera]|uniref:Uncharacterized protein n=1 Tax=Astrephomene gubernaculifera TaxID=47775 RepID=A0AAD3DVY5_9CHLO|nr:hypothetical protein Agub_g9411 [Astrephomene gubernaculifera]